MRRFEGLWLEMQLGVSVGRRSKKEQEEEEEMGWDGIGDARRELQEHMGVTVTTREEGREGQAALALKSVLSRRSHQNPTSQQPLEMRFACSFSVNYSLQRGE